MSVFKYTRNFFMDSWNSIRCGFGRTLRQIGLQFDRKSRFAAKDIAYLQKFNRHRNILSVCGQHPIISQSAYISPNATVFGDVYIGKDSYFGMGSVAHGLTSAIRIGSNTKIGDNTVLDCAFQVPDQAFPSSLNIGNNINIEHGCYIRSCIIDDRVNIGFRTVIMEGSQLERGCYIAPNSYVPAASLIPQNTMWAGNPIKFVKYLQPYTNRLKQSNLSIEDSTIRLDQI